jgi:exopolyphosphatase / guanosine-5'-triphosphate,3'-diphosphate pyrophosphatase
MSNLPSSPSVAVVDIGSNSIKVLVATRTRDGTVQPLKIATIDARISAGISRASAQLGEAGMAGGLAAVQELLAAAAEFQPSQVVIVATSAVRDAVNGEEFRRRVHAATGHEVRILSGDEEANLIGRGLTCDPALRELRDFYVFDLGGGSLECLAFQERHIRQGASLQLGCVRLTEKFVENPAAPLLPAVMDQISIHTKQTIAASHFRFSLSPAAVAVGTGGTLANARGILGAREGKSFDATPSVITVAQLRELLTWLGALPLPDRRKVPGLPPARADVFPTALATLVAVADLGGFVAYQNSVYNLRYGLADATLPPA